jgi:uncharacterized protein (DUF983 family)
LADVPPPSVPGAPATDANDALTLTVPGASTLALHLFRGATLRCPSCGSGGILRHWFRLKDACPACGVSLHRGESDFYIGAIAMNLALAEGLFALALTIILVRTWPAVPWDAMERWAPLAMLATPILTYPSTKLLWLAWDLAFRPDAAQKASATLSSQ